METVNTVAVLTGSEPLDPVAVAAADGADRIVAADGGLDHARAAGLIPDVLVGDLDSVSADGLRVGDGQHHDRASPRRQGGDRHRARPGLRRGDAPAAPRARCRARATASTTPSRRSVRSVATSLADIPADRRLVGFGPRARRPTDATRPRRPAGRHDVLAARPPRTVPRRDDHRLTLAARRRRPRLSGRARRLQRSTRTPVSHRASPTVSSP